MATLGLYEESIEDSSQLRLTALLAFARNNEPIDEPQILYDMSLDMENVVQLGRPIKSPDKFGFDHDTPQIVWNHHNPVGRTAKARRFWHEASDEEKKNIATLAREAVLDLQETGSITSRAYAGLDEEFCVGLQFVGNRHYPIAALSFLLNFQALITPEHNSFYRNSRQIQEPDMLLIYDPDWFHPDYEGGLVIIDRESKTIIVLGRPISERSKKDC